MDPLLLAETLEGIEGARAADPGLTTGDAIQSVVHGGTVHEPGSTCYSTLCNTVTEQLTGGR